MHAQPHGDFSFEFCTPFPQLRQLDVPKGWSLAIINPALREPTPLRMATLRGLYFNGGGRTASLKFLSQLPGLRELRVAGVDISTPDELQRIASLVPDLEILTLPNLIDRGMDINIHSVPLVQFTEFVSVDLTHILRRLVDSVITTLNAHALIGHLDAGIARVS